MTIKLTVSHTAKYRLEKWSAADQAWVVLEQGEVTSDFPISKASGPGMSLSVWTDADEAAQPAAA